MEGTIMMEPVKVMLVSKVTNSHSKSRHGIVEDNASQETCQVL